MAKPRMGQFAKDLGVSKQEAEKLMTKARKRKDGGSETMRRYHEAMRIFQEDTELGTSSEKKPRKQRAIPKSKPTDIERWTGRRSVNKPMTPEEEQAIGERMAARAEGRAAGGLQQMSCSGYGKAIQGTKFTGVK